MKAKSNKTGKIVVLYGKDSYSGDIASQYGYKHIDIYDFENHQEIIWEGIDFNRLYMKDNIIYRFNQWHGKYPYVGIELEEIGIIY